LASSTTVPKGSPSRIALPLPRATSSIAAVVAARQDDVDPRQVERVPVERRRAGDEGAVVEGVGELGERAEPARQARIDDLDGDAQAPRSQRATSSREYGRAGRGGRSRASSNANSHSSLGAMKRAALQGRPLGARVVHPRRQERPGDRAGTPSDSRCAGVTAADLPAADRAEIARAPRLEPVRLGQIARDARRGPGRNRASVAARARTARRGAVEVGVVHAAIVAATLPRRARLAWHASIIRR
jgi:hypothetical protein